MGGAVPAGTSWSNSTYSQPERAKIAAAVGAPGLKTMNGAGGPAGSGAGAGATDAADLAAGASPAVTTATGRAACGISPPAGAAGAFCCAPDSVLPPSALPVSILAGACGAGRSS